MDIGPPSWRFSKKTIQCAIPHTKINSYDVRYMNQVTRKLNQSSHIDKKRFRICIIAD